MARDTAAAAQLWEELWRHKMLTVLKSEAGLSIEELDAAFAGRQSIYNWATDYDAALTSASQKDQSFVRSRINFYTEYIAGYSDKTEHNMMEFQRSLAETYFQAGESEEGERLFKQYLAKYPTWGWGWIGWSDQYWLYAEDSNKDSERAISLLQQALEVTGLEDREDVLERLQELYTDLGMV